MKYLRLASVAALISAATVSAGPLGIRENDGYCPKGYTMSVYYKTIYPSATSVQSTVSSSSTTSVVVSQTTTASTVAAPSTSTAETKIDTTAPAVVLPTTSLETLPVQPTTVVQAPAVKVPAEQTTTKAAVEAPTTKAAVEVPTTTKSSTSPATTKSPSTGPSNGTPGKATFYGGNVGGGTCSFSGYTLPSHLFGAALSLQRWDDAANCGSCVSVTGPNGNSIKAMIVDQCPECESNHIDLFQNAFAELSDISAGIIQTTWSYVSCDLDGPLKLKNKEGTSAYWFSMQVVNANEPVTSLEVSTDGGSTWQGTTRQYYNFFENSAGFGTSTVDVRITGASGKTVVVKSVGVESGNEVTAKSNL
ncbi:Barwin-related endoglucanase [Penicillium cf. griseofulvum]|uniref:Barwin-related endoglucanase n=1 Tax=Penicillium cf. griseofulvum TaxID=2972120 RepID=A0A9W9MEQ6_9EURO|nr:Barwin-related endoglucanase [Penicillium cf. griseofulvum]KAJ5451181.1 Barwin-related endoglucanase [Penicillium cf. griseofulvum]